MANDISLIILSGGNSTRFGQNPKKQWINIKDEPLWLFVVNRFKKNYSFDKIVVVGSKDELNYMSNFCCDIDMVASGQTRQKSIQNAITHISTKYVMISDTARCCFAKKVVKNLIKNHLKADCIVPTIDINDTIVYNYEYINRDKTKLVQTPQLSNTALLKKAISSDIDYTDESSAIKANDGKLLYIKGDKKSHKITTKNDIKKIDCLKKPSKKVLVGFGYDIHKFINNKPLYLCGVKIDSQFGLQAHSDGDVAIHSVIDAIIGAIGAGDIGDFFPDNDNKYKDISSVKLLEYIVLFVSKTGFEIVNIDMTIVAQIPKISPHKKQLRYSLSKILKIKPNHINIKATTNEQIDTIGDSKAICVYCVANLKYSKV